MSVQSRSSKAYTLRFGIGAAVYTVLVLTMLPLARRMPEGSVQRYLVASLPVLGVGVCVWALWRYVTEADELQARRLMEALALATAGTMLVAAVVSMCQSVGAPALDWTWVIPLWAAWFAVGMAYTSWKYR